jgi:hypothetical protein
MLNHLNITILYSLLKMMRMTEKLTFLSLDQDFRPGLIKSFAAKIKTFSDWISMIELQVFSCPAPDTDTPEQIYELLTPALTAFSHVHSHVFS